MTFAGFHGRAGFGSYSEDDKVTAKAFNDKVPVLLTLAAGTPLGGDR